MKNDLSTCNNLKLNIYFIKIDNVVYSRDMKKKFNSFSDMLSHARKSGISVLEFKLNLRKKISNTKSELIDKSNASYKSVRFGGVSRYNPEYIKTEYFEIKIIPSKIRRYPLDFKPDNQSMFCVVTLNKLAIKNKMKHLLV